jgi:dTDP-4-amino-4,6-dideoxygalactose transaminase
VPSEIVSAFLYAQLEMLEPITVRRRKIYEFYQQELEALEAKGLLRLPRTPANCTSNYHMFYILLPDQQTRNDLMASFKQNGILAVFHYIPLHTSPIGRRFGYREGDLPITEELSGRLLRLPFYYEMTEEEQLRVIRQLTTFLGRWAGSHDQADRLVA